MQSCLKVNYMRYLYLILIVLMLSCCRRGCTPDPASVFEKRLDSVLLHIARAQNLYYPLKDSAHPQSAFPLVKTVKYEGLNLNFQFRQGYDCHSQFEIILCYNDSLIYGIPFTDNYYFSSFGDDSLKYLHKLSFEQELNKAIGIFSKCYFKQGIPFSPWYSETFVKCIMDNMTKYNCRKINPGLGDLEMIRKRIREEIQQGRYRDEQCKLNALKNILNLEKELMKKDNTILLYDFFNNNCIYRFDFASQPQNGKFVTVSVVNKECFIDLII